ncbi:MAG: DUF3073 domain-containing protein [Candidatus Nanopelagicales bacterium]
MGRGRAKAKQTKVARALKYGGPQTDFDRLQAELATGEHHEIDGAEEIEVDLPVEDPYATDPYAKYYEDDDEDQESKSR